MDAQARMLWGNRRFLALWLGQAVSNLGDKLLQINAIGVALAAAAGAGGAMAQILIWTTLPTLVLGLAAGMVVDRANRRSVMIVSDLVRAALVAALPVAAGWGLGAVCGLIAWVAAAACFFGPARTALIPSTVTDGQLVAANAWFAASGFVIALIGTTLGSWLLAGLGLSASLWINAGVFGLSVLVIGLVRIRADRPAAPHAQSAAHPMREFRHGLGLIRRRQAVRALILHYALLMGLATACYVGLVGLSGHTSALGLRGVSWLLSAAVVGLILGGLLAHRLSARLRIGRLLSLGLLAIGIGALGVARSGSIAGLMAWLVLIGTGGAVYAAIADAALQRMVPDTLRGRVLAARGVLSSLAVLVVAATSGWLIDHAGKTVLFGAVAVIALGGALIVWWATTEGLSYRLIRWVFRQLSFAYLRMEVQGLEHIPTQGGAIIAGNHPNVLDGLWLLAVSPRPVRFLIAEDLYTHRYLHGFFKALGMIPVYRTIPRPATAPRSGASRPRREVASGDVVGRGTKTHNGDALRGAIAALQRGELLGIFPEGTTAFRGAMQEVKKGVGLLALKTGCPVVPLALHGSDEAFPKGTKAPRPRRVVLRFEEPVRYQPTDANPIPEARVAQVLEDIRLRILGALRNRGAISRTWSRTPRELRDTRRLGVMRRARPSWDFSMTPEWLIPRPNAVPRSGTSRPKGREIACGDALGRGIKELQIALSALIVVPLSSFLTCTANPSLDPNEGG